MNSELHFLNGMLGSVHTGTLASQRIPVRLEGRPKTRALRTRAAHAWRRPLSPEPSRFEVAFEHATSPLGQRRLAT